MIHKAFVKGGLGKELGDLGAPAKAAKRAAQHIGCAITDLDIIHARELRVIYWYDHTAGDVDYWLKALNLTRDDCAYIGTPKF